jgi:hypothetical protein
MKMPEWVTTWKKNRADAREARQAVDAVQAEHSIRKRPDTTGFRIDFATVSFAASSVMVNFVAFVGQFGYAQEHFGWSRPLDAAYAVTIESVAVTVAAYAHAAQRVNDSAFRTKLASYAIGLGVGVLNYSHFAGPHWNPTAKSVALGLLSAISPWLWGLYSKRRSRDILLRNGLIDGRSVRLGAARWSLHPVKSFRVLRYAAWSGIQDPQQAIAECERFRAIKIDKPGSGEKTASLPPDRKQVKAEVANRKPAGVLQPEDARPEAGIRKPLPALKPEATVPPRKPEAGSAAVGNDGAEEPDIDTSARALAIYLDNPEISGAEMGRKLGISDRGGRYILQGLKDRTSGERHD